MKIEFETDINDYQEARKFKSLISLVLKQANIDASVRSFAQSIDKQLDDYLAQPEFEGYGDVSDNASYTSSHDVSAGQELRGFFRRFLGPGKFELELNRQRQSLISRAERAEASAFEALAETAEVGRERDELKAKLKELESALNQAKS